MKRETTAWMVLATLIHLVSTRRCLRSKMYAVLRGTPSKMFDRAVAIREGRRGCPIWKDVITSCDSPRMLVERMSIPFLPCFRRWQSFVGSSSVGPVSGCSLLVPAGNATSFSAVHQQYSSVWTTHQCCCARREFPNSLDWFLSAMRRRESPVNAPYTRAKRCCAGEAKLGRHHSLLLRW